MGMNRTPLLFPVIYLFLYFSHQSTLWLNVSLNFEMHNLVLCCFFFPACLLHLTSAHLPVLSDFISHLFYSLSAFFDFVSLSLFSVHLPPFLPSSVVVHFSHLLALFLSQQIVFLLL